MLRGLGYIGQETLEGAIQSLRDKGAQYMAAWANLMAVENRISKYPDLYARWKTLAAEGAKIKNTISYISEKVDAASGFLSRTFGLSGMNAMGVFPILPVAYVVGAVSAIAFFMANVSDLIDALARREMAERGFSPEEIGKSRKKPEKSALENISTIVLYAGVAAFGIIVLPKLLESFKRR